MPLCVVGAGAAGLWAAARAAELGVATLVLEKTPRTGTKVLASGGTRCNLTTTLPADRALELFGRKGARFLRPAFRAVSPMHVRERFHDMGVPTVEAALDKVFPASQRARDVRDALLNWAVGAGAEIRLRSGLSALRPCGENWLLRVEDGTELVAANVILASGGKSFPRTGTTGDGYAWLADLGLEIVPPVPALVPLSSPAAWVRELAGIALQEIELRSVRAGRTLAKRARPLLFTHRGLSGPGAMDLSEDFARAEAMGDPLPELRADLLPGLERAALRDTLLALAGKRGAPSLRRALADELPTALPRRLVGAVLEQAKCPAEVRVNQLGKSQRHTLLETLKSLAIPIDGTLGFEQAEVTAGGLALGELDPGTLAVKSHAGLFVCGELLDLTGPIGGLNFQSAFSTAELSARGVARRVGLGVQPRPR